MRLRPLLQKLVNPILAIGGVLGLIITIVQFYSWWQPRDATDIIVSGIARTVVSPARHFTIETQTASQPVSDNWVTEVEVILWRDGGQPIDDGMVRRPFRVPVTTFGRLLGYEVLDVQSSISDNFSVSQQNGDVVIDWTTFDPDMAVRIALLVGTSERMPALDLEQNLGPYVNATTSPYNLAKNIATAFMGLVGVAAILLGIFPTASAYMQFVTRKIEALKTGRTVAGWAAAISAALLAGAGSLGVVYLWIVASRAIIPPIPFVG